LFLAERELTQTEYDEWNQKCSKAKDSMDDEKVAAVNGLIEKELTLIGSTAIEDKLQDEVANTIHFMKDAGIKVWVLTGDKVETAINIGISAGLLDGKMDQHVILSKDKDGLAKELTKTLDTINNNYRVSKARK